MDASFFDALRQIIHEKGIPQELVLQAVERGLLAAYRKRFHTDENAVVRINPDNADIRLFARKEIVEEMESKVFDLTLEEARELNPEAEIGDEILIEQHLEDFGRIAAQTARQQIIQKLKDIEKNIIYEEFISRKGELINGYYQREKNGIIFVNLGKTEGILPGSHQSPRENFHTGDRIKAYLYDVENEENRPPRIILSRGCPEFVKKLFEMEVPEIYDGIVQIKGIVRVAGFRTKVAVYSTRDEVDPVGTCVGMKGVRIQAIIREIEGEKIDILKYSDELKEYIKNAMSPARISRALLLNEEQKNALVVVPDSDTQLSLAIGKSGLNVKLASRLTGWNIDIKTESEFQESDLVEESVQRVQDLFAAAEEEIAVEEEEDRIPLASIPGFTEQIITVLKGCRINDIEQLIEMDREALTALDGITDEMASTILSIIEENVEVVDEDVYEDEEHLKDYSEESEELECGNCNGKVTTDMSACPSCGAQLIFE